MYMVVERRGLPDEMHVHLKKTKYKFKRLQEFMYLGWRIIQKTWNKSKGKSWKKYHYGINKIFKSRMLSKILKIRLDKQDAVMYGNWTRWVNKTQENNLLSIERKRILRKIFSVYLDTNTRKRKILNNKEINKFHCYSLA